MPELEQLARADYEFATADENGIRSSAAPIVPDTLNHGSCVQLGGSWFFVSFFQDNYGHTICMWARPRKSDKKMPPKKIRPAVAGLRKFYAALDHDRDGMRKVYDALQV